MLLRNLLIVTLVFFASGCMYTLRDAYRTPPTQEEFTQEIFVKLDRVSKIEAYRASKKYKMIKKNSGDTSPTPKMALDEESSIRLLEILRDKQNYNWVAHKRAVFIPSIGYKLYTTSGEKIDVVFSFAAKQVRFSEGRTFVTIDCDPIAPEMKRIADHILSTLDKKQEIEFDL